MKKTALLFLLLICFSCAPKEEIIQPQQHSYIQPPPPPASIAVIPEPEMPVPKKYRSSLKCEDKTSDVFNSSGLEVLPFVRPVFYDIDGDGIQEMIAGSKDGRLRLYKPAEQDSKRWVLIENYFDGIIAGAFSSPAIGDIDNDGKAEVLIGTGGFSSESGKVVFYKNTGSSQNPLWEKMKLPEIHVGNDATPALFDVDNDNKLDLIAGNSIGRLFLFRNRSKNNKIIFNKDADYFNGINLGMYVVPAVTSNGNKIILIAGNSMGKVYLLEKTLNNNSSWNKSQLHITIKNFAAPAFVNSVDSKKKDLVISDSHGQLYYFRNSNDKYAEWEEVRDFFNGRILPGPACNPSITNFAGNSFMVVGNIDGEIKLYAYDPSATPVAWSEIPGFFNNIKLPGFSRGIITDWQGSQILITGQQDGILRAFLNQGTFQNPAWVEQKKFFSGLPKMLHAAPAVFDIDGDGQWELMVGNSDGYVKGFRYEVSVKGEISWKPVMNTFDWVKVRQYAIPALFRDNEKTYLLIGQQDGKIIVFTLETFSNGLSAFMIDDLIPEIQMNNHSSPTVFLKDNILQMSVGDYNGNLKHFACKKELIEVQE